MRLVIHVASAGAAQQRITVDLGPGATPSNVTVRALKEAIREAMGVDNATRMPDDRMRLVCAGHVLRDDEAILETYGGIAEGAVVHLVVLPVAEAVSTSTRPPGQSQAQAHAQLMPGLDDAEMQRMMDSPMSRALLSNPELMRTLMMSTPGMKRVVEENPEMAHMLADDRFMREITEQMRNPELRKEMMRNQDRALSNIESLPGGMDALRRMYGSTMEPLLEGAYGAADGTAADEERRNRAMAERLHVQHVPDDRVNDQALPNPWAPPPPPTVSPASGSARGLFGTSPFGGAGMFGMPPGMGFPMAGPGQSSATSSSATSPLNSMMQQLAQNPDTIMQMMEANPLMSQMLGSPGARDRMRQMMASPMFGQMMSSTMNNPALMSAAMQQSQRGMGAPFAMGQPAQTPTTTSFAPVPAQPTLTASDQLAAAEARFTAELDQLHAMGFTDRRRNVRALLAAGGNVDAAVNFLLG